jgi:GPH family glycoside/pentoside/hexuronide:cation symporter
MAILQGMLIYFYKYILNDEAGVTLAMIALLVVSLLAVPLWVWAARKIGKKLAYICGMTLTLLTVLIMAFFGDRLGAGTLVLMAVAGIGFSSHYVLPWSMAPDTIEYGFFRSGVRREGIYYSIWTFVIALGGALAGFLIGQGLDLTGYIPNVAQPASSALGIRLLIGPLPAVLILLGNLALFFYPLNQKRYEEMIELLRERAGSGKDPALVEGQYESDYHRIGSLGTDGSTDPGEGGLEGGNLRAG